MADRFERLYELPSNLYSAGSPVIVAAGALLKDTQTGTVVVQLKYQSVSEIPIKALRVDIVAYDVAGNVIQGKNNYQYLDMTILDGQTFGNNKAIFMPDATTRSFTIGDLSVVLSDGTTLSVSFPLSKLPLGFSLQQKLDNAELVKQFRNETNQYASLFPSEALGIWMCSCGKWNLGKTCTYCKSSKNTIFSACDLVVLTKNMNARLAAEKEAAQRESERKENELILRKARNKKIAKFFSLVMCIVFVVFLFSYWFFPAVIEPNMVYREAHALLACGEYDEAKIAFLSLGDFKDSSSMQKECAYQKANELISTQEYEEAIKILMQIPDYRDAKAVETHARYLNGCNLLERKDYKAAYYVFNDLGDYEDSKELTNEARYQYAETLHQSGDIEQAISIFADLTGYKDSEDLYYALQYSLAQQYFDERLYEKAKPIFLSISSYEDCIAMARECDYQKGCYYYESGRYLEAIDIFEDVRDYYDVDSMILSAYSLHYYDQGKQLYNNAQFYKAIEILKKSEEPSAKEMITKSEEAIAFINKICGYYGLVGKVSNGRKHYIPTENNRECRIISFDYDSGQYIYKLSDFFDRSRSYKYNFDLNIPYYFWEDTDGGYGRLEGNILTEYEDKNNYEEYRKER